MEIVDLKGIIKSIQRCTVNQSELVSLLKEVLFVQSTDSNSPVILKLFDIGQARTTNKRGTYTTSGVKGTQDYIASEFKLINSDDENEGLAAERPQRGSQATDVFGMGCVFFYYLTNGYHPFG